MYILVDVSHPLTGVTVDAYAVLQHIDIAVIANKNLYVCIMVSPLTACIHMRRRRCHSLRKSIALLLGRMFRILFGNIRWNPTGSVLRRVHIGHCRNCTCDTADRYSRFVSLENSIVQTLNFASIAEPYSIIFEPVVVLLRARMV